jgi:hypothetical protein
VLEFAWPCCWAPAHPAKRNARSASKKDRAVRKILDAITDPKLKDAVAELGGSLLLLERAQLKLDSKPVETEYGDDALAVLKHYPRPGPGRYLYQRPVRAAQRLQFRLPDRPATGVPLQFQHSRRVPVSHGLEWQSVTLNNKRVIAFQPEWSETDPGIQLSPSSSNLTSPDDLTVTYPFIEGLDIDHKNQPQPVSLQGKLEVIAPRRLYSFDLTKKDVGQTRTNDNLSVTLLKLTHNYAEIEFNNNAPLAPEIGEPH